VSTISEPQATTAPSTVGPYRFGWRMVQHLGPDGKLVWEQVPLKQEDLLHPEEEDFIVHDPAHDQNCFYLKTALVNSVARVARAHVNHNVRTDWGVPGVAPHGPDLAVFLDVPKDWDRHQGTFMVAKLGARPILVIEVTSPSTRAQDFNEKVLEYHQARVPFYAIVDYCTDLEPPRVQVLGYRTTPEGYVRVPLDERGWLWLEPVKLWLTGEGDLAVCYDEQANRILEYADVVQQADARVEEALALTEEAIQDRNKAKAEAAEAAKARQQAENRADKAQKDAEEQAAKAALALKASDDKAADLVKRLAEMEAKLRQQGGQT
jgi:colicin import membrane protein